MLKRVRPILALFVLSAVVMAAFAVSTVLAAPGGKSTICHAAAHKFVEITVSDNALPAHMGHGDVAPDLYGDCP